MSHLKLGQLILMTGGARSGKSHAALALARARGTQRLYVATAQAFDQEMSARIERHRRERPDFETHEEPQDLSRIQELGRRWDVMIVDCLTLWLSNLICADRSDVQCQDKILEDVTVLRSLTAHMIIVSNEVGFGIVPDNALARRFRDLNGRLQQELAAQADEVYLAACGLVLPLHKLGLAPAELR